MKDWNRSLKIGDYVFSKYRKDNFLYRVIDIHRRYVDVNDLKWYSDVYAGCYVGEEKSPMVTIQRAYDFSVDYHLNKRMSKKRMLDISYLMPFEEKMLIEHIKRLSDALEEIRENNP